MKPKESALINHFPWIQLMKSWLWNQWFALIRLFNGIIWPSYRFMFINGHQLIDFIGNYLNGMWESYALFQSPPKSLRKSSSLFLSCCFFFLLFFFFLCLNILFSKKGLFLSGSWEPAASEIDSGRIRLRSTAGGDGGRCWRECFEFLSFPPFFFFFGFTSRLMMLLMFLFVEEFGHWFDDECPLNFKIKI